MPGSIRNTVDRLDKPSAYYQGRVSYSIQFNSIQFNSIANLQSPISRVQSPKFKVQSSNSNSNSGSGLTDNFIKYKKRRYERDGEDERRERTPEEPVEDPLKDATTLYVGNLYVKMHHLMLC